MDYKEFITNYDTMLNMPVTEDLIFFQIVKFLLEERVVAKEDNIRTSYFYKITDILKENNLLNISNDFKCVGTLNIYKTFIKKIIDNLLSTDKYDVDVKPEDEKLWYERKNIYIENQFVAKIEKYDYNIYLVIKCMEGIDISDLPLV